MAVTSFIPEVWAATVYENWRENGVIGNVVSREYQGDARMGNVVHITEFAPPTIKDYAAGESGEPRTIDPEDLSDESQALLINQEKAFSFYVDDIDERQAAGSLDPVMRDAGMGLVEDTESYLANMLTTQGTPFTYGDGTTPITTGADAFNLVKEMRTRLSSAAVKAPGTERTLLVNPEFAGLLLGADSKLVEVDTSGSEQGLRNATLGRLLGFDVVECSLLNPGVETAIALHRSAAAFVQQIDKVEAIRAPRKFADIFRGLGVYGAKVLRAPGVLVWQQPAGA